MPMYVYKCDACGQTRDVKQKITDEAITHCPTCHSEALKRIPPKEVAIQFKGPGFYINDYSQSSSSGQTCGHGACDSCKP